MNLITPTTELEAVNEILSSIGESPVNSLESGLDDANMALQVLRSVSRAVQSMGWYFNREFGFKLSADDKGVVYVPENTLRLDSNRTDFMLRAGKIYDANNHTYTLNRGVCVDLVLGLDFEELPEVARCYITLKSARVFQQRTVGSQSLAPALVADEQAAWMALKSDEINAANNNLFDNPYLRKAIARNIYADDLDAPYFIGGK
ncbi:hypothetical protein [Aeromonas veronii]|uniref:hypothetical protein n=1 Tax=Aeromonas veronii TaxID=654 RepID=UPI003BA25524